MTKSVQTARYAQLTEMLISARRAAGLTQHDLGRMLGKPQSFVSKIETGERRLDLVEFLSVSEVLRLDACAFLKELSAVDARKAREVSA
jgi:transcriptional regulator with XRE-family HTH domain